MTKNNVINHVNKQLQKLHFKMHKHKKQWIVIGMSTLAIAGGITATTLGRTSADDESNIARGVRVPKLNVPVYKAPKTNQVGFVHHVSPAEVRVGTSGSRHTHNAESLKLLRESVIDGHLESTFMGAPNHFGREIPDSTSSRGFFSNPYGYHYTNVGGHFDKYDIGGNHGGQDIGDLQDSAKVGKSGHAHSVLKANLNSSNDYVKANFKNAGLVKIPVERKGNVVYKTKKADVIVTIGDIHFYKPWLGKHSIVFSRELANGIQYNGIKSMTVHYDFMNPDTGKPYQNDLGDGYMRFKKVDAISNYGYSRGQTQDDATNNQNRTRWIDDKVLGINVGPYFGYRGTGDNTGEFVYPVHHTGTAYVGSKNSTIRNYKSKLMDGNYVIGGYQGTLGIGKDRDVYIKMNNGDVAMTAGSGLGYGEFVPETDIKVNPHAKPKHGHPNKPKPPKPKPSPGSKPQGLNKYITNDDSGETLTHNGHTEILTRRNQNFDYNITGNLPSWKKKNSFKYYNSYDLVGYSPQEVSNFNQDTINMFERFDPSYLSSHIQDFFGTHWENEPQYKWQTHKRYYNGHKDDHYTLTDNLPKEVRINSGKDVKLKDTSTGETIGNPDVEQQGDHVVVKVDMNWKQLAKYSQDHFHLVIPVTANNLPKDSSISENSANHSDGMSRRTQLDSKNLPTSNNDVLDNNQDEGYWYKFKNGADGSDGDTHVDEQLYKNVELDGGDTSNDPSYTKYSNNVTTKIRAMKYHVNHYDHGSADGTPIDPSVVNAKGNNYQYDDNDEGSLSRYTGTAFEGDEVPIKVLQNDNPADHEDKDLSEARYRYGYDDNNGYAFARLGYNTDNDTSSSDNSTNDDGFEQDFNLPYILPQAKVTRFGRLMVATDKGNNNLPFRLDLKSDSFLFRNSHFMDDFAGDTMNIDITSNGSNLYSNSMPLTDVLNDSEHGKKFFEKKGKLNTQALHLDAGSRVPLQVHISYSNPSQARLGGLTMNSHAWTSSESSITGQDFHHGDNASVTKPERTIKYFNEGESDNPRTQFEKFEMHQNHKGATAKTGLGLRSNLSLDYFGHINANKYGENGTDTDYAFPDSWTNGDSNINYRNNPYNDNITNPTSGMMANGKALSDMNNWYRANREHGNFDSSSYNRANKVDRLLHINHNFSHDISSSLDTINMDSNQSSDRNIDDTFGREIGSSNDGLNSEGMPVHDTQGHYSTEFHFAPRAVLRDSGVVQLQHDEQATEDNSLGFPDTSALASNKFGTDTNADAIKNVNNDRMYTPLWLPLGYYNTSFEKATPSHNGYHGYYSAVGDAPTEFHDWYNNDNDKRLGGNFFNYEDNMFDQMVGHEYLADNSKSENNDVLSIQPVLGGNENNTNGNGQSVQGFSQKANNWVQFKDNWKSFFGL